VLGHRHAARGRHFGRNLCGQVQKHPDIEGKIIGTERSMLMLRVHRQRLRLEAAHHQPAPGRPQVDRGVHHPDDRVTRIANSAPPGR